MSRNNSLTSMLDFSVARYWKRLYSGEKYCSVKIDSSSYLGVRLMYNTVQCTSFECQIILKTMLLVQPQIQSLVYSGTIFGIKILFCHVSDRIESVHKLASSRARKFKWHAVLISSRGGVCHLQSSQICDDQTSLPLEITPASTYLLLQVKTDSNSLPKSQLL